MRYLHKSVFQSHGYLSSANCHVDSRWVLKISGFALRAFRKEDSADRVIKYNDLINTFSLFNCSYVCMLLTDAVNISWTSTLFAVTEKVGA